MFKSNEHRIKHAVIFVFEQFVSKFNFFKSTFFYVIYIIEPIQFSIQDNVLP